VAHPVHQILNAPLTYGFSEPIAGTYPLWYDPTHWHTGLKPHWNLKGQLRAIGLALLLYCWIPITYQLSLTASFVILRLLAMTQHESRRRAAYVISLVIPVTCALILYALVYAESRYLAPFVGILWLVAFSGLRFPDSNGLKRLVSVAAVVVFV